MAGDIRHGCIPALRAGPCDAQGRASAAKNRMLQAAALLMTPLLTTNDLFESQSATLKLKWVAGHDGRARLLEPSTAKYPGMALVGHLNFVHPNRIQVIGEAEIKYLQKLSKTGRSAALRQLFGCERTAAVVVANGARIDPDLKAESGARAWRCSPRRCRVRWSSTTSSSTSRARSRRA